MVLGKHKTRTAILNCFSTNTALLKRLFQTGPAMDHTINLPIFWYQDRRSIRALLHQEYPGIENTRSILVKAHCLRKNCGCVLKDEDALLLRCVRDIGVVQGVWTKAASSTNGRLWTPGEKLSRVILSTGNPTWYEVLNEGGKPVPHWTSIRDVVKNPPTSGFLLRKDVKCIFAKNNGTGSFDLNSESSGILKAGLVLTFIEFNTFRVLKSRKVKETPLVKCLDPAGHVVFLHPDEKCIISPLAGPDSISGVHSLFSVIQKFQFPLSVRPVFGSSLASWLPSSERHFMRLSNCYQGNLVFLESLSGSGRFFVVTTDMLEDHVFSVGESESPYHSRLLDRHSEKVNEFLGNCHPFDGLRYLLKHLIETTNSQGGAKVGERLSSRQPIKGESDDSGEDVDRLFDEIEDIYYYVRTGRFPHSSRPTSAVNMTNRPRSRAHPPVISAHSCPTDAIPIPPPMVPSHKKPGHYRSCQHLSPRVVGQEQNRSNSCDDLFDCHGAGASENYPPPPPLPPRLYLNESPAPTWSHNPRHRPPPPPPPTLERNGTMTGSCGAFSDGTMTSRCTGECSAFEIFGFEPNFL